MRCMTPKQIVAFCLGLPAVTHVVQWEGVSVFKVGGKMFCLFAPEGHSVARLSMKCPPEHYEVLSRSPPFRPAPYLARATWVALDDASALPAATLKAYIARAHSTIAAALPRRRQQELGLGGAEAPRARSRRIMRV
jgi:predicted DNA-binding protein (MmcQ/YjbR family)